ncbi:MAG: ribonuclease P protein component [Thermodesulfobacteriota bacterium]
MDRSRHHGLALPKSALLLKPWQYTLVYSRGKRLRGRGFSLIVTPAETGATRLGISVHGMAGAVRRNRVKRIIREFFRLNRSFIAPPADVVITVRPDWPLDSPMAVAEAVHRLLVAGKGTFRSGVPEAGEAGKGTCGAPVGGRQQKGGA